MIRNSVQFQFANAITEAKDGQVFVCKKKSENTYEFVCLENAKYKNGTLNTEFQKIQKQINELRDLIYNNQQVSQEAIELLAEEIQSMKVL